MYRRIALSLILLALTTTSSACSPKQSGREGDASQTVAPGQVLTGAEQRAEDAAGAANSAIDQQQQQIDASTNEDGE